MAVLFLLEAHFCFEGEVGPIIPGTELDWEQKWIRRAVEQ